MDQPEMHTVHFAFDRERNIRVLYCRKCKYIVVRDATTMQRLWWRDGENPYTLHSGGALKPDVSVDSIPALQP